MQLNHKTPTIKFTYETNYRFETLRNLRKAIVRYGAAPRNIISQIVMGHGFQSHVGGHHIAVINGLESRSFVSWFFEDNSLFLLPSVESAREDVGFVSSVDQEWPDDDYTGEWLHVNDHGNATLYLRENGQDKEIWGII